MSVQGLLLTSAVPYVSAAPAEAEALSLRAEIVSQLRREIVSAFRLVSGGFSPSTSRRSSTDASVQVDEGSSSGQPLPDIIQSSMSSQSHLKVPEHTSSSEGTCRCYLNSSPDGEGQEPPTPGGPRRIRPRSYTDSAIIRTYCYCLRNKVCKISAEFEELLMKRLSQLDPAPERLGDAGEDVEEEVVRQTGELLRQIADELQEKLTRDRKASEDSSNAPVAAAISKLTSMLTMDSCLWAGIALHICVTVARKLP